MDINSQKVTTNMEEKKKLSYDELARLTQQYIDKCNALEKRLNDVNYANFFTRLDYLFKVIQSSDKFSTEFVVSCTEEIEDIMTIKKENGEDKTA